MDSKRNKKMVSQAGRVVDRVVCKAEKHVRFMPCHVISSLIHIHAESIQQALTFPFSSLHSHLTRDTDRPLSSTPSTFVHPDIIFDDNALSQQERAHGRYHSLFS